MKVQIKLIDKLILKTDESKTESSNLYGWITSLVGKDDLFVDEEDLVHDDEILMIDLPIVADFDYLDDSFCRTKNYNEFFRGMIVCSDKKFLHIRNVETGTLYCFNKSKDFILKPKRLLTFKYVAIPCALAITEMGRSMSIVLLRKYDNSKTKIRSELEFVLNNGDTSSLYRGYAKILEFKPSGICRISHINSTAEFYIQLETDILELHGIIEDLEGNENSFAILEVITGQICLVFHPINYNLYRAQIISIHEEEFKVKLIDYGNNIVVKHVYSTSCSNVLLRPPIAQKCCLRTFSAAGKFTTVAEKRFKRMAYMKSGGIMNVNILRLGSFNLVELFHRSCSIADDLISSQIEDDLDMSINSYSYRASMDDNELADL